LRLQLQEAQLRLRPEPQPGPQSSVRKASRLRLTVRERAQRAVSRLAGASAVQQGLPERYSQPARQAWRSQALVLLERLAEEPRFAAARQARLGLRAWTD